METEQTERVECQLATDMELYGRGHASPVLGFVLDDLMAFAQRVRGMACRNADLRARLAEAEGRAAVQDASKCPLVCDRVPSAYFHRYDEVGRIAAAEAAQDDPPCES